MDEVNIKLIHPTNNSDIDIACPKNILLQDIFNQLIDANFLSSGQTYTGLHKRSGKPISGVLLDNGKTIGENSVENNDIIQILVATQAGGSETYQTQTNGSTCSETKTEGHTYSKTTGTSEINILGITNIPKVSFDEMIEQKQSIVMVLNSYQKLEEDHREVLVELNKLKQKNSDRKSAVVVNTVAGIVIAVGAAFLTESIIPSIASIVAGVLLTGVGIWLAFKNVDD